jgi:membrane protein DedA with SNARE-associated domain
VTYAVLGLVRTHTGLLLPIVFCLAFGESLAFVSLLLPATVILVAIGGLIGAANVTFWPEGVRRRRAPRSATGSPIG